MILLRQKLYTRAEQAMWKELHRATNGYRRLPSGYKNMTVRDAIRLDNITRGYYKGKFNPEDVQTLATHLELPETAKTGTKVLQKYTNPELIERFKSIKAYKLGVGKEREELVRLEKELTALREKRDAARSEKEWNKYRDKIDQWWDRNEKTFMDLQDTVYNAIDKDMQSINEKISKHVDKQNKLKNLALEAEINSRPEDPDLSYKLARYARKNMGIDHIYLDNRTRMVPRTRTMYLDESQKFNPAAIGHEAGHRITYDRQIAEGLGYDMDSLQERTGDMWTKNDIRLNPAFPLGNEYRASLESIMAHKKVNATPKQIADSLRNHKDAYESYYHIAAGEVPLRFYEKLSRH